MHSYVYCNMYIVTFIAIHTQLRLLQYMHGYVCCNIYMVTFVTATSNVRDIVHSENATHQPLTEFIMHIQPEPIFMSIHPSESTEHKLPRPVLPGHTKADYIYIFTYIYHFSIITSSILAYPPWYQRFLPCPPHFYTKSIILIG